MVAAGLGFAFMPVNMVKHPGVVGLPVVNPEFWRQVRLVSVRGRRYSPGVGSLVREAMRKTWFGKQPNRSIGPEGALERADVGEVAA
jgi:LysR family transcriptional regulator, hydrogen peroxide-inducible genes activator